MHLLGPLVWEDFWCFVFLVSGARLGSTLDESFLFISCVKLYHSLFVNTSNLQSFVLHTAMRTAVLSYILGPFLNLLSLLSLLLHTVDASP